MDDGVDDDNGETLPPLFDEPDSDNDEGVADDAEDAAEQPATADAATTEQPPKKKRQKKVVKPVFGVHSSTQFESAQNPQRNAAQRAQEYSKRVMASLNMRADIKIDVLNRVILQLSSLERAKLREQGAMQQEVYLAKRDLVEDMKVKCFNALNAIDLRACEALPVRQMQRIADRLSQDEDGKRMVLCKPPDYKGAYNPLTQKSNREQGIKYENKSVLMPRIFPRHSQVVAAGRRVIDGRTLYLADDFDGAAWNFLEVADDLLSLLEGDSNMLVLPPSVKRALQLIFDGHGFLSRSGAVRFTLRSPHTIKDHNATRNARDPIFFIGTDKHLYLEKAVQIGGEDSLSAHMYAGVIVTETDPAEMPAHVQSDKDYLPLACIG